MKVIKVENLGKKYLIGHDKRAGGAFNNNSMRDTIYNFMAGISQKILHPLSPNRVFTSIEEFWALKNINFEVDRGDRVGIIGHNGAGKTTLLKLLSRITHPSTGYIKIKGRIASLLEVGTGFHPELTGRENIYLNGAILGMKRHEIKKRFDEIVSFAEVEKFLDTPVKRYSSGMYVRLAFSIAAHLEPEILIVDEVLAVGDAAFQKKSLDKMRDVSTEGRTVLFVSHNMDAIRQLCTSAISLKSGEIQNIGDVNEIIDEYFFEVNNIRKEKGFSIDLFRREPSEKKDIKYEKIMINNKKFALIKLGESLEFYLEIFSKVEISKVNITIRIINEKGESVITILSRDKGKNIDLHKGINGIKCEIEQNDFCLLPGKYYIASGIDKYLGTKAFDVIMNYPAFEILNQGKDEIKLRKNRPGYFYFKNAVWSRRK